MPNRETKPLVHVGANRTREMIELNVRIPDMHDHKGRVRSMFQMVELAMDIDEVVGEFDAVFCGIDRAGLPKNVADCHQHHHSRQPQPSQHHIKIGSK